MTGPLDSPGELGSCFVAFPGTLRVQEKKTLREALASFRENVTPPHHQNFSLLGTSPLFSTKC